MKIKYTGDYDEAKVYKYPKYVFKKNKTINVPMETAEDLVKNFPTFVIVEEKKIIKKFKRRK